MTSVILLTIAALCFIVLGGVMAVATKHGMLTGLSVLWAGPIVLFVLFPALCLGVYVTWRWL